MSPPLTDVRVIPRLVDSAGQAAVQRGKDSNLDPSTWSVEEVAQFLQINECASLVDAFTKQVRFLSFSDANRAKCVVISQLVKNQLVKNQTGQTIFFPRLLCPPLTPGTYGELVNSP